MFGGLDLGNSTSIQDIVRQMEDLNRSDAGGNVGQRLPGGSLFDLGSIIGNDGFPTFDPYSSIRDKPALSELFEAGAFNDQITKNVLDNLNNPEKLQEISDAAQRFVKTNVGTINRGIIDDAVSRLPPPSIAGDRPPIQNGPSPTPKAEPPPQYKTTRPDESGTYKGGTVGGGSSNPVVSGGGVPKPPTVSVGGGDNGFDILDIFRNLPDFGGGSLRTPGFAPGGDMDIDDLLKLPIFGGGGSEGGSANASATGGSNFLSDLIGAISNDNALSTVINAGLTDYAADSALEANSRAIDFNREVFERGIDLLEPFRQAGLSALPGVGAESLNQPNYNALNTALSYDAPEVTSTNGLPTLNPGTVDVNQIDVFNREDPALRFLQQEAQDSILNNAAAAGMLQSGSTLEALQDRAANVAATYAGQLQNISSAQDRSNLAADSQGFFQDVNARNQLFGEGNTQFGQGLNLAQLGLGAQGQEFGQNLGANQFYQGVDQQNFNQLFDLSRLGSSAASGQSSGAASQSAIGSNLLNQQGDIRTARTTGFTNALSNFF